jgi:putative copper export protein
MAHVNRTAALLGSPYGRVLVLKVATVAVVALLGWRNWKVLTPRLEVAGVDALRTSIVLELSAALLVLALTAALVITPPPMEGM